MSRKVRVTALTDINREKGRTVAANLDWTCMMLDKLAVEKPDVVCLTETFDTRETPLTHPHMAQTLDGETVSRMKEKAKQYNCYIVCAFIEQRDIGIFNVAAVIDRQGNVIGNYDKIHPTISEIDDHVVPGACAPRVIQTDFGKIGCMIWFDANWPDDWKALKQAGAEIVFFPPRSPGRIPVARDDLSHSHRVRVLRTMLPHHRPRRTHRQPAGRLPNGSPALSTSTTRSSTSISSSTRSKPSAKPTAPASSSKSTKREGCGASPQRPDLTLAIVNDHGLETLDAYIARSTKVQDENRLKL